MKKFTQFVAEQAIQNKIVEAATLMAKTEIEPVEFLKKHYEETYPELTFVLNENWWDGVKNFTNQVGQGFKSGAQAFNRATFGPEAKFAAASKSLSALLNQLQGDPQLKNWTGSQQGVSLTQQLSGIINQLSAMGQSMPKNQVVGGQNTWTNRNGQPPSSTANHSSPSQPPANQTAWSTGYET